MSDTYGVAGPNGGTLTLNFLQLPGLCPTLTFTGKGQIVTVCSYHSGSQIIRELLLLNQNPLQMLSRYSLPSGGGGASGFGSGGYMVLHDVRDPAGLIMIASIGCRLTLTEIYERVTFPPPRHLRSVEGGSQDEGEQG